MFKLIPRCAKGSWLLVQAIGTTPVILGRKLPAQFHFFYEGGGEGGSGGGGGGGKSGGGASAASSSSALTTTAPPDPTKLRYVEVDVDVTANPAVGYVVAMVQGATKSLWVDHGWLLESQKEGELPEKLVGACRFRHLDMTDYTFVEADENGSAEIPMAPARVGAAAAAHAAYDAEFEPR
jgi:hypothetical protein